MGTNDSLVYRRIYIFRPQLVNRLWREFYVQTFGYNEAIAKRKKWCNGLSWLYIKDTFFRQTLQ